VFSAAQKHLVAGERPRLLETMPTILVGHVSEHRVFGGK